MRAAWIWALLIPLAAAGCVPGTSSGPTSPNLPFDGLFKGETTPILGAPPPCPGDAFGTIVVGDGTLVYPYRPSIVFVSVIGKDGSIHGQEAGTTLDGKLIGDRLDFTIGNATCKTHYVMRRLIGL